MKMKTILLGTVVLTLGSCSAHAGSYPYNSGPRFTPRADVSQDNYSQENRMEDRMDDKFYDEYEQREPCQNYRKLPRNYANDCFKKVIEDEIIVAVAPKPAPQKAVLPIVNSYTLLFDFDKSGIRSNEMATLDQITQEIKKYHPKQVTVTGYTDSHGTEDYNQTLSHQREQAVSSALLKRGIENQTIKREARGEYDQAVKTADGVKNQENRRVVVDFRR